MKHVLLVFALCLSQVGCVDTEELPDDEEVGEGVVEAVTRDIDSDDPTDVEIEMSEVQQAASSSCSDCVASRCAAFWGAFCTPQARYREAFQCYRLTYCTHDEYMEFRPRTQEP